MSLDAMEWVWERSHARGVARLVLLAIADRATGVDATAYAGTTMLVRRSGAARSSVIRAVDHLVDTGELAVVSGARGPRGETVYRIPGAAGPVRTGSENTPPTGGISRPVAPSDPSGNETLGGPETTPQGSENDTPRGPNSTPQNARERKHQAEQQPRAHDPANRLIPELRPLATALDSAGLPIRWTLGLGEQRDLWRLAQRHGLDTLVHLAAQRHTPGTTPKPARYWLRVWGDLDRHPATTGPNVVPHRTAPPSHTDNLAAGLALLKAQEGTT